MERQDKPQREIKRSNESEMGGVVIVFTLVVA
jgi:hypothetical protein